MKLRTILSVFLLITTMHLAKAQYAIKGNVNLGEEWQPKIFMAAINKLSDYYRTSPDMIVNTAEVKADGSFLLEGDNLPDEPQFYRLYLMKKQNTDYDACLYVGGDDHNFVHILLENGTSLDIETSNETAAPFGKYEIRGSPTNQLMQNLARIVFPSFYFYRIKFPTELKFSEDKLHVNLKEFTDTCSNTLVALAAINNTDFDEYFDRDKNLYERFGERLKRELPKSIYTKNYLLKVKYYANEEYGFPVWASTLISFLMLGVLSLVFQLNQYRKRIVLLENQAAQMMESNSSVAVSVESLLTQKEKEILQLIGEGKSNKEIASALFVELSTVKTHINKIYSKLGVSNRKEAQAATKQLKLR